MRWGITLLLIVLSAFMVPASRVARAQPPVALEPASPVGPATEPAPVGTAVSPAEAKADQARASQLFREDRFTEAAELLRHSYLGDPRPILLFNAGQAYRKADRVPEAKELYEQFLAAAPQHPLVPETRGYIKDMEAILATQARALQIALELEARLEATRNSQKQAARELENERLRSLQTRQKLLQTQAQLERERNRPLYRRPWFWGVMTVVGTVVISTAAVGGFMGSRAITDGGTVVIGN